MMTYVFLIAFLICGLTDCYASRHAKSRALKPFLMPLLAGFYVAYRLHAGYAVDARTVVALLFAAAGDTFLMLQKQKKEIWFLCGMLAFGVTHVLYVVIFSGQILWDALPAWTLPVIIAYPAAYVLHFRRLLPQMSRPFRAPCLMYAALIVWMNLTALFRVSAVDTLSFVLTFSGALLFLISDSILSLRIFLRRHYGGVMETYLAGQLLIILGMLTV